MTPEQPSQPDWNEPLDAEVLDTPPVAWPTGYLYQPQAHFGTEAAKPVALPASAQPPHWLAFHVEPAAYVVPQRFGLSAIWGIITALCLLYGGMRWIEAWPAFYLFAAVQVLIVCLVQMFHGQTPRLASAITGAILAPVFLVGSAFFVSEDIGLEIICILVVLIPIGAFLGYLTGTCAAGVFLVMDKLEPWLKAPSSPSSTKSS